METLKGTVQSVSPAGNFTNDYGTFYKFAVEIIADGTPYQGEYSSKSESQNKFITGQQAEFIFEDGKYPKIKPPKKEFSGGGGGRKPADETMKNVSVAFSYAKDLACDKIITPEQIPAMAERFYAQMKSLYDKVK